MLEDTLQAFEKMLNHNAVDIHDLSGASAFLNAHSEDRLLISSFLSLESGQKLFKEATTRVKEKRSDDTMKEQLIDVAKALQQQFEASKDQDLEMTLEAFKLQSEQMVCAGVQCTQAFGRVVWEKMKTDLMPHAKSIFVSSVKRANVILPHAENKVLAWAADIEVREEKLKSAKVGTDLDAVLLESKEWKDTISRWILLWQKLTNTEEALGKLVADELSDRIPARFRKLGELWDHVVSVVDAYLKNMAHKYLWEDGEEGSDQRLQILQLGARDVLPRCKGTYGGAKTAKRI